MKNKREPSGLLPSTPEGIEQLKKKIVSDYKNTEIPGKQILHGTDKSHIESIRQGPKELKNGLGGPGLNVTPYRDVAAKYATGNYSPLKRPVIMSGKFNPSLEIEYRVIRVEFGGGPYGKPINPTLGHFPIDWARHHDVKEFVKNISDIVYNVTPFEELKDFYVIRESAGQKVIIWEGYYPCLNRSRINPNGASFSFLPENMHPYFPNNVLGEPMPFNAKSLPSLNFKPRLSIPVATPDMVRFNPPTFKYDDSYYPKPIFQNMTPKSRNLASLPKLAGGVLLAPLVLCDGYNRYTQSLIIHPKDSPLSHRVGIGVEMAIDYSLYPIALLGELANGIRDLTPESLMNNREILEGICDIYKFNPEAREHLLQDFDNGGTKSRQFINNAMTITQTCAEPLRIFHDAKGLITDTVRQASNEVSIELGYKLSPEESDHYIFLKDNPGSSPVLKGMNKAELLEADTPEVLLKVIDKAISSKLDSLLGAIGILVKSSFEETSSIKQDPAYTINSASSESTTQGACNVIKGVKKIESEFQKIQPRRQNQGDILSNTLRPTSTTASNNTNSNSSPISNASPEHNSGVTRGFNKNITNSFDATLPAFGSSKTSSVVVSEESEKISSYTKETPQHPKPNQVTVTPFNHHTHNDIIFDGVTFKPYDDGAGCVSGALLMATWTVPPPLMPIVVVCAAIALTIEGVFYRHKKKEVEKQNLRIERQSNEINKGTAKGNKYYNEVVKAQNKFNKASVEEKPAALQHLIDKIAIAAGYYEALDKKYKKILSGEKMTYPGDHHPEHKSKPEKSTKKVTAESLDTIHVNQSNLLLIALDAVAIKELIDYSDALNLIYTNNGNKKNYLIQQLDNKNIDARQFEREWIALNQNDGQQFNALLQGIKANQFLSPDTLATLEKMQLSIYDHDLLAKNIIFSCFKEIVTRNSNPNLEQNADESGALDLLFLEVDKQLLTITDESSREMLQMQKVGIQTVIHCCEALSTKDKSSLSNAYEQAKTLDILSQRDLFMTQCLYTLDSLNEKRRSLDMSIVHPDAMPLLHIDKWMSLLKTKLDVRYDLTKQATSSPENYQLELDHNKEEIKYALEVLFSRLHFKINHEALLAINKINYGHLGFDTLTKLLAYTVKNYPELVEVKPTKKPEQIAKSLEHINHIAAPVFGLLKESYAKGMTIPTVDTVIALSPGIDEVQAAFLRDLKQGNPNALNSLNQFFEKNNSILLFSRLMAATVDFIVYGMYMVYQNASIKNTLSFDEWLQKKTANGLSHWTNLAFQGFKFGLSGMSAMQIMLNSWQLFGVGLNSLTITRKAISAIFAFPYFIEGVNWLVSLSEDEMPATHKVILKCFVDNFIGNEFQQLVSTHDETIMTGISELLRYSPFGQITTPSAEFLDNKNDLILNSLVIGRAVYALSKAIYESNDMTNIQYIQNIETKIATCYKQLVSAASGLEKEALSKQIASAYCDLKYAALHFGTKHPAQMLIYVNALYLQHQFANEIEYVNYTRDGNSFFHAVSCYTDESMQELRNKVADYIIAKPELLKCETTEAFNQEISRIRQSRLCVNNDLMRQVLSKLLQRPILIVYADVGLNFEKQGIKKSEDIIKGNPIYAFHDSDNHSYHGLKIRKELYFEEHLFNKSPVIPIAKIDTTIAKSKTVTTKVKEASIELEAAESKLDKSMASLNTLSSEKKLKFFGDYIMPWTVKENMKNQANLKSM